MKKDATLLLLALQDKFPVIGVSSEGRIDFSPDATDKQKKDAQVFFNGLTDKDLQDIKDANTVKTPLPVEQIVNAFIKVIQSDSIKTLDDLRASPIIKELNKQINDANEAQPTLDLQGNIKL